MLKLLTKIKPLENFQKIKLIGNRTYYHITILPIQSNKLKAIKILLPFQ